MIRNLRQRILYGVLACFILYFLRWKRRSSAILQGRQRLASQRVVITGAAGGLGGEIAKAFVENGCKHLVLWDLSSQALERVAAGLRESDNVHVDVWECNLCDMNNINSVARSVLETGRVDILVNNAGVVTGKEFLEIPVEQVELTMRVNVMAHIWTTRAFLPRMIENSGSIINIASCAGLMVNPRMTDYCASKFAAVGFAEALRVELKASRVSNVKVLVVCPAHIQTSLFQGAHFKFSSPMEPSYVAQRIVEAHLVQDTGILTMPFLPRLGVIFRSILPSEIYDVLAMSEWAAMQNFDNQHAAQIFQRIRDGIN